MRPSELDRLLPTLERLATYGGARPDASLAGWLRTVGAVAISPESDWAVPTTSWLDCATPANDALDLLRRTAVRDPGYRAHLDLVLASVLHTIGIAERWKRFEELIQGSLQPFSPRFVQLLEWLEGWTGTTSRALNGRVWLEAEALVAGPDAQSFSSWDATLWGASGNVSTVFALLQDHYIPLIAQPVHLCLDVLQIDQSSEQLLIALVEATRRTEGVLVSASQRDTVRVLLGIGVPLRVHSLEHSTQSLVGLIGRVSVSSKTKPEPEAESLSTRTWGNPVPDAAIRSVVANFERQAFALTSTLWAHVD
jgi:hypothetical protein